MFKKVMIMVAVVMMVMVNAVNVFAMTEKEYWDSVKESRDEMQKMYEEKKYPLWDYAEIGGAYFDEQRYHRRALIKTTDGNEFEFYYIPDECEPYIEWFGKQYTVYVNGNEFEGERKFYEIYHYMCDKYFNGDEI